MSKIMAGVIFGIIVGILVLIPMWFLKLPWDAYAVAFLMPVIAGFLIATSNLRLKSILKGILLLFLVAFPMVVVVAANHFTDTIHMVISNLISGALLGFVVGKFDKK
ncbi:MAG: hypothetical protein FD145_1362 [Candidatus Saganbacteria bacterium]|uniref:TIGR04086 family membrane protein n=1 Tax=Candidatus Saganbacteria bacterium TaxID=2575572 RepID=A0A833L043_UNCSA|nr:MAG: hypothetical protein FD145_1362 [Candidatus Saganbacteria bacterium]